MAEIVSGSQKKNHLDEIFVITLGKIMAIPTSCSGYVMIMLTVIITSLLVLKLVSFVTINSLLP